MVCLYSVLATFLLTVLADSAIEVNAESFPGYNGPGSVSISEGEPPGTEVFSFTVSDPENDALSVSINHDKKFYLAETSRNNYQVKLKEQLDRETENRYSLVITIDDSNGHVVTEDVTIRVRDVNDYTPIFSNLPLTARIREDQPAGAFVLNVTAKDEDSGYNAALELFLLEPESKPFYLGDFASKEPLEHSYGSATLLLKEKVDFEENKLYLVPIRVRDTATCPESTCEAALHSDQTIIVDIIDVQDTPPFFNKHSYQASTYENRPTGSDIVQISAQDGDSSSPRDIQYAFLSSDGIEVTELDYFSIDPVSGWIRNRVIIDTDSETVKSHGPLYTLQVQAKERLRDGEAEDAETDRASVSVTITLLDTNDQMPTFSTSHLTPSVGEELSPLSSVSFDNPLTVTDTDQGINGTFSLEVLDSETNTTSVWFDISPISVINKAAIRLNTKQRIDYETTPNITVKIVATEEKTGRTSYTTVTVIVEDSNDNAPQFILSSYNGTVSEAASLGDPVILATNIRAVDVDSQQYGTVQYVIKGDQSTFAIDRDSGQVTVACDSCLDRETTDSYYLNILASDGGLTDTAQLVIHITDYNDNKPVFSASSYRVSVNESATQLNSPPSIQATDKDLGDNGLITFRLLNETEHLVLHSNGTIEITKPYDAEQMSNLTLHYVIKANDGGEHPLSTTATLEMVIRDINDNVPVFAAPAPVLEVEENSDTDKTLWTVQASDSDVTTPNNAVFYSIISDTHNKFSIDSETGVVKLIGQLDKEGERSQYILVISAQDGGHPVKSAEQAITVKVVDVNDETPEFTEDVYTFEISENSERGRTAGVVLAQDPDSNSVIQYSIISSTAYNNLNSQIQISQELFAINAETGALTVQGEVDREAVSKIVLSVQARDINGVETQISTCLVEILVEDINDNAPVITPVGMIELVESPTVSPNSILTKLTVIDADQDSQLVFRISNNPDATFAINDSGEVRQVKPIDRETSGNWMNFTVVVRDGADNSLSSSLDIPVYIRDRNDNAPRFIQFESVIAVPENKPIGSNVSQVIAVDDDFDPDNKEVHYKLKSDVQSKLNINRLTGVITVAGDLDRDTGAMVNNSLVVVVEACDSGIPKLCTEKTFNVRVTDVNDNKPTFTMSVYTAKVSETADTGDIISVDGISQIEAIDIDAAPNGQNVEYSCCRPTNDSNSLFGVDSQGQLFVTSQSGLRGRTGTYSLTVSASDWGTPRKTGVAQVLVIVEDYNDHAPILSVVNGGSTVHRPENSEIGSIMLTIQALDEDIGLNSQVDFEFVKDSPQLNGYMFFSINVLSDEVNLISIIQDGTFDRENQAKQYQLGIIAKDRGTPQLSSAILVVTIIVDDVNDNLPYFPTDKQRVPVSVREEEPGVFIENVDFARDDDERNIFCYYISGARNSDDSSLPARETVIRDLFVINPQTGEVKLAEHQSLDREKQSSYVLVIMADDRDENVYNNCDYPPNLPWTHERTEANEMELLIQVDDIDDTAPRFSTSSYTVAVVRDRAPSVTLIQLRNYVTDDDLDQTVEFSLGRGFDYTPPELQSQITVRGEPVRIYSTGEIQTELTFTKSMQGSISFGVVASDKMGHSSEATVQVLIVDSVNVALFTISRDSQEVLETLTEFLRYFAEFTDWNITVISVTPNTANKFYSDVELHVIPAHKEKAFTGAEVVSSVNSNSDLSSALRKYGLTISMSALNSVNTTEKTTPAKNPVIFIVIAIVLLVVVVMVLGLCYFMRNKYKRKLKAAHAMAFDTHTHGFDIDQDEEAPQVTVMNGTLGRMNSSGTDHTWNKEPSLNNFDHDFMAANCAYESESHRSNNSVDDNAIDPLNSADADTQSCSSAGSNDWRLDLRGNNLDCSPPPPVVDDVINAMLNQSHNQIECERKFSDSLSDQSQTDNVTKENLTPTGKGHFNRLIMSDSVYGRIYETRRMPNGLETTEV